MCRVSEELLGSICWNKATTHKNAGNAVSTARKHLPQPSSQAAPMAASRKQQPVREQEKTLSTRTFPSHALSHLTQLLFCFVRLHCLPCLALPCIACLLPWPTETKPNRFDASILAFLWADLGHCISQCMRGYMGEHNPLHKSNGALRLDQSC